MNRRDRLEGFVQTGAHLIILHGLLVEARKRIRLLYLPDTAECKAWEAKLNSLIDDTYDELVKVADGFFPTN